MDKADRISLADFYSADAEALRVKYRQVEQLIGLSHHSVSEGTYCEVLLKEFLRRTLPRHVSVDTGFIRRLSDADWSQKSAELPIDAPIATPQLDIIVHDTEKYAPLFRSEDFVAVVPEAVRAIIEVKKTLDWTSLSEALMTTTRTTHLLRKWRHEPYRVFTCIFAFSLGTDLSPTTKALSDSFETSYQKAFSAFQGDCELPDLLVALPRLALQKGNHPQQFDLCPTAPENDDVPNVAGQLLVFLVSNYTSWGTQGRALVYPETIKRRSQSAFAIQAG